MTVLGRIAKVCVGFGLIWTVSIGITSQTEELGFGLIFAMVLAFWIATTLIQMALCIRFSQRNDGDQRFGIGTIFLVMSYLAIYLMPIRLVIKNIASQDSELPWTAWIAIGVAVIVSSVILSALQLHVAEAIISSLVAQQKSRRIKKQG